MKEELSALIDNALNAQERERAIDRLLDDPELQKSWVDAYTASDLMGKQPGETTFASTGFAARVSAAIDEEPTVFAPTTLSISDQGKGLTAGVPINAIPVTQPGVTRLGAAPLYALAASMALLAVLLVSPLFNPQSDNRASNRDVAQINERAGLQPSVQTIDANEIEALMVEHGEFSGMGALNGLLAYAKVVNAESALTEPELAE